MTVHGFAKLVQEENQIGGQAGDMQRRMSDNNVPDGMADISTQTIRRSADFAAMERRYEALGTAPRADMGDSIRKAFSNIEDILTDMNLPVDEEHTRAVQILGYNRTEITEENIAQIIEYDRAVNDMLAACHPNAVLSMIRDGINPLDMTVDELNQTLRDKNYKAGVKETDDFATYLRDVEKRGQISSEARAGYIGLYRVFKQLEKSGDREAGYLFANNSRLTVRNLITAMRSRKAAGMEAVVDDSFGMLADLQTRGEKMDDQIARAYAGRVGADGIRTGQIRMGENDESVSQNEPMAAQEEYKNPWEKISDSPMLAQAEQLLQANDIEESAQNLEAADYILQGMSAGPEAEAVQRELVRGQMHPEAVNHQASMNFYTFASQIWKQIGWQDHTKEDAVDAETDAMAKSLTGEEIALPFESEMLLKQIEADADLAQMYADIRQQMVEQMYDQAEEGNITSDQLQGMKVDPQLICVGPERAESGGYLRTKELLSLENPPDAIFCCYDQMAIGAIHALRESGLRIPEDMAVMGFDNLTSSKYIEGGITTIANPYEDMLSVAVNILTKRTKNPQMSQQQIALRPNLVVRHTT